MMNKAKKCNKGFPCGKSCISKLNKCWANLSTDKQKLFETYSQFVNRIVGTGNDKESSIPQQQPVGVVQPEPENLDDFPNFDSNIEGKVFEQLSQQGFNPDEYSQIAYDNELTIIVDDPVNELIQRELTVKLNPESNTSSLEISSGLDGSKELNNLFSIVEDNLPDKNKVTLNLEGGETEESKKLLLDRGYEIKEEELKAEKIIDKEAEAEKVKQQPKVELKDLFTEPFKEELYDKYEQIGEDDKLMYSTYPKGKYVTYILEHGVHQEKQLEFILGAFKSKVVNPRFFTRYKKDIDKLVDFKKANKTFPVNEENLKKIIFEPTIEVSWSTDYPDDATDKDKLKVALEARKMWKESILPQFEEGQVLFNTPIGGFNGARAKAYMKQGFSPVDIMGYQYAIVENGKLVPFEVFPEAEFYKKDSITSEEFKKQTNYN